MTTLANLQQRQRELAAELELTEDDFDRCVIEEEYESVCWDLRNLLSRLALSN